MRKLAVFALSFSAAIFAAQYAIPEGWLLCLAGFFALIGIISFFFDNRRRLAAMLAAFSLAIGFLWYFGYSQIFFEPAKALDGQSLDISAEVLSYPEETSYGSSVTVKILREGGVSIKAILYLNADAPDISPGDRLELNANLRLATAVQGSEVDYYTARSVFLFAYQSGGLSIHPSSGPGIKYIPVKLAKLLKDKISEIFPEDTAAMMRALLSGDTGLLSDGLYADLKVCGLAHVVAVSGLHVSFLVGMVSAIVRRRKRASLICFPMILLFMAMTGNSPSVVRAGIMQFFILSAPLFHRENDSVTSLSAALLVLLLSNPFSAASVGLQLSFASTSGIIIFTGRICEPLYSRLEKLSLAKFKPVAAFFKFITSSFAVSVGAIVFTTPLVILHFGYVSLIAPLANLLALWAVSLAFAVGLVACLLGFIWVPIGAFAASIASLPLRYVIWTAGKLAKIPFAAIYTINSYYLFWVVYVYILAAGFILLRGKLRRAAIPIGLSALALCAVIVITTFGRSGSFEITAVNVGQGQSIVLMEGCGTVVVDCGGNALGNEGDITAEYLLSNGRAAIDLLVLTHFHSDHANGVTQLLERVEVKLIAVPNIDDSGGGLMNEIISAANAKGIDILYVDEEANMSFSGMSLTLYPPIGKEDENERGLTVLCSVGDFDVLITGDMGGSIEKRLIKLYSLPDIELLVAGHHGSKYSTSTELLEEVSPEIVFISVGYNSYGHPDDETLERLLAIGAEIYRTDTTGNVTVRVS